MTRRPGPVGSKAAEHNTPRTNRATSSAPRNRRGKPRSRSSTVFLLRCTRTEEGQEKSGRTYCAPTTSTSSASAAVMASRTSAFAHDTVRPVTPLAIFVHRRDPTLRRGLLGVVLRSLTALALDEDEAVVADSHNEVGEIPTRLALEAVRDLTKQVVVLHVRERSITSLELPAMKRTRQRGVTVSQCWDTRAQVLRRQQCLELGDADLGELLQAGGGVVFGGEQHAGKAWVATRQSERPQQRLGRDA